MAISIKSGIKCRIKLHISLKDFGKILMFWLFTLAMPTINLLLPLDVTLLFMYLTVFHKVRKVRKFIYFNYISIANRTKLNLGSKCKSVAAFY